MSAGYAPRLTHLAIRLEMEEPEDSQHHIYGEKKFGSSNYHSVRRAAHRNKMIEVYAI